LEIIPTIGPIVSAIPAIIVVLNVSPAFTFVIIAVYMGIQAIENNFLVPKIMQRAVGLNPIVIILGIILGAELMGVVGALLSIPFISLLVIIFKSLKKFES
ncbi:MAG: AI-2E family transporter, partial [Patescibacteria group bacterium]